MLSNKFHLTVFQLFKCNLEINNQSILFLEKIQYFVLTISKKQLIVIKKYIL